MLPAAWEGIVGEGSVRADEHIVLKGDSVPDLDTALDGDAISDADVVLDERVVGNVAGSADHGAGQDVDEGPDAGASAHGRAFDDGRFVFEKAFVSQCGPPARGLAARRQWRIPRRLRVQRSRAASGSLAPPARWPVVAQRRPAAFRAAQPGGDRAQGQGRAWPARAL